MPSLGSSNRLVADVAVDLTRELLIAQTQAHGVGSQIIQQLRISHPLQILRTDGETLHHRVPHGRRLLTNDPPELGNRRRLLSPPKTVLKQGTQQPGTEQRPAEFTQRQRVQPAVKHHKQDTGERQRYRKQRSLHSAKTMRGGDSASGLVRTATHFCVLL